MSQVIIRETGSNKKLFLDLSTSNKSQKVSFNRLGRISFSVFLLCHNSNNSSSNSNTNNNKSKSILLKEKGKDSDQKSDPKSSIEPNLLDAIGFENLSSNLILMNFASYKALYESVGHLA